MKKIICPVICSLTILSTAWAQKKIMISNPSANDRVEIVSIAYSKFSKHFGVDSLFTVKDKATGKIYLHQLEKLGTNSIQNVLIQVPITPKRKINLTVTGEIAPSYPAKTYARYIPERKDDFAWENDVVAFRYYGKALEGTSEDAQGIDFWAKRTSDLVINDWYMGNDYHEDHGQGLDYYSVGQTLGAGDMALYYEGKIQFTKHYRNYQILDNGPLRTTFRLIYAPEQMNGRTIVFTKTVSIDAGQQFNKIEISFLHLGVDGENIVLGLARRNESESKVNFDSKNNTLTYWEPSIKNFGQTGTALIVANSKVEFLNNNPKQFLLKTFATINKPLIYYNGASWNKAGKIANAEQWKNHVEDFAKNIQKPLKVKLK